MRGGQDEPLPLHPGEPRFLILLAFILTLAGTRFYTRMARIRKWPSVQAGGVHVHHLVHGVVLSLVSGGLAVGLGPRALAGRPRLGSKRDSVAKPK